MPYVFFCVQLATTARWSPDSKRKLEDTSLDITNDRPCTQCNVHKWSKGRKDQSEQVLQAISARTRNMGTTYFGVVKVFLGGYVVQPIMFDDSKVYDETRGGWFEGAESDVELLGYVEEYLALIFVVDCNC